MIMGDGIKLRLTGASHRCPLLLSAPDCPSGIFWCPVCKPLWRVCRSWSGGMSRPDEWRPVDTRRMNARLAAEELDREDQTTSATSACEFYAMCLLFFFSSPIHKFHTQFHGKMIYSISMQLRGQKRQWSPCSVVTLAHWRHLVINCATTSGHIPP